jgi:hypothetical protein
VLDRLPDRADQPDAEHLRRPPPGDRTRQVAAVRLTEQQERRCADLVVGELQQGVQYAVRAVDRSGWTSHAGGDVVEWHWR